MLICDMSIVHKLVTVKAQLLVDELTLNLIETQCTG
jgi:hypothetical protein